MLIVFLLPLCYIMTIMSTETMSVPTAELNPQVSPEYEFANHDRVEELRESQAQRVYEARLRALNDLHNDVPLHHISGIVKNGAAAMDAAELETTSHFDDEIDEYVGRHIDRDQEREKFDRVANHLKSVSHHNMSNEEWYLGEKDEDGNYKPGTSGRERHEAALLDFSEPQATPATLPNTIPTPRTTSPNAFSLNETDIRRKYADFFEGLSKDDFDEFMTRDRALNDSLRIYASAAAAREQTSGFSRKFSEKKVEQLRNDYETLHAEHRDFVNKKMLELGYSPDEVLIMARLDDKTDAKVVGQMIRDEAFALAQPQKDGHKLRNKFYRWWAEQTNHNGVRGKVKKAAVMTAIGVPVGLVTGLLLPVAAGGALGVIGGSALAGGAAKGVARSLVRHHISKNAGTSIAEAQYQLHEQAALASIDHSYNMLEADGRIGHRLANGDTDARPGITRAYAWETEKVVKRNRDRFFGSVALGAVGGALGAVGGHFIAEHFSDGHLPLFQPHQEHIVPPLSDQQPAGAPHIVPPLSEQHPGATGGAGDRINDLSHDHTGHGAHHATTAHGKIPTANTKPGAAFNVEYGSGEIHEIQEFAHANGYNISDVQASQLYAGIHERFGRNIINLAGKGPDTYMHGTDVRLMHPGTAHWYPGVEDEIRQQLKDKFKDKYDLAA